MNLIRFEPYLNTFLTIEDGVVYSISPNDIAEIKAELGCYEIITNGFHPAGAYSAPIKTQIQATRKCNQKCITCGIQSSTCHLSDREMNESELLLLIKRLKDFGVLNIEWSGGEPMVRPDFKEIVEYTHNLGLSQNLLTNGLCISQKTSELLKRFYRIQISLDAVGDLYDKIVGVKSWSIFNRAIDVLREFKLQEKVVIATVLQQNNVKSIGNIIEFCGSHELSRLRVSLQIPLGRSKTLTWKDYSAILDSFRTQYVDLKALAKHHNVSLDSFLEKTPCSDDGIDDVGRLISPGGYSFIYIDASGDAYPFPFLTHPEFFLANVVKQDELINIWHHSPVLDKLRMLGYHNTGCKGCRLECAFAERSTVYAFTGKIDSPALPHRECLLTINHERR